MGGMWMIRQLLVVDEETERFVSLFKFRVDSVEV